jgi:hypothetical protein
MSNRLEELFIHISNFTAFNKSTVNVREAFFHFVIVPHMAMYQSKASFLNGERAGVRVTICFK